MGRPVTLDSDDLEFLLYAAGAMKHIEMALYAAKTDFQYNLAKPRIADVVDRANHAWLAALHDEPTIEPDSIQGDDRRRLLEYFADGDTAVTDQPLELWRRLREVGAVEMGVVMGGFKWADKFDVCPAADGKYGLRLTPAGKKLYYALSQTPRSLEDLS